VQIVGGKFEDRYFPIYEILLIADILVGRDKEIEFRFGKLQEVAVGNASSSPFLGGRAVVADQKFVHRPRNAFVEQDFHAAARERRAASERSRIFCVISRVTDGKHSRNSSSE